MRTIRRLRPSPGVLIGTIALVFAFTGAAVAASKIETNEIAKRAVTDRKLASNSVKGGKIVDGKVKAKDLAEGVIPAVPQQAYGRVDKTGANVTLDSGAVGIEGVAAGGPGMICYDLAFDAQSGSATVAGGLADRPGATVELLLRPPNGCAEPFTDAATSTRELRAMATAGQPLDDATDRDLYVHFVG